MVRTLVRHRGTPLRRFLRVRSGPDAGLVHRGAHAEAAVGRPRAERATRAGVVRAVTAPECRGRGTRMAEVRARGGGSRAGSDAAGRGSRGPRERAHFAATTVAVERVVLALDEPPAQLGAVRRSERRISAGVTPAPERSERAHGHPRSNFAKGIARVAPSVSRTPAPLSRYATSATNSASSGLGTSHSFAHLRHFRNAPRVLLLFASAPTYPHSGHVSATGLSQTTKSQFG